MVIHSLVPDPVLHVALAARLGPAESAEAGSAPPLRLRAASGPVRLIDAAGRRFWVYREGLWGRETVTPRWYLHGLFA